MLIVAFSGGKDSICLALELKARGEEFKLLFTPTGNELPELIDHINYVVELCGVELILPKGPSLEQLILKFMALPSNKARWCTRMIKIVPCVAYLKRHPGSTLAVGLRADEESRIGLYGDFASYRYPLREWGMNEADVLKYIEDRGIKIPERTDCALCPYQRIGEWYRLWKLHPEIYEQGIQYEKLTEHTFRPPKQYRRKDGSLRWAIGLEDLAAQFAAGDKPKTLDDNDEERDKACRVCSL